MTDTLELMARLKPAVLEAGAAIMAIYTKLSPGEVASKSDGSPVTEADLAADAILRTALADHAPDIMVVSEENAQSHTGMPADRFILVDPLDGTREFIKADGKGAFTVNIGLIESKSPIAGIVYAPALNQYFVGAVGEGAWLNDQPISAQIPGDEKIAVASLSHRDEATDEWLQDNNIQNTRSIGSSLKFGLLAVGDADVYPRFGPTMEWDTAAGDAVLRAAGGRVETPAGATFSYGKEGYRNGPFIAYGAS
ncbi:MAG: 3'(2'),5'-bisphosphate nucleotidase CysQ [Pseudomonadota bacterium]